MVVGVVGGERVACLSGFRKSFVKVVPRVVSELEGGVFQSVVFVLEQEVFGVVGF